MNCPTCGRCPTCGQFKFQFEHVSIPGYHFKFEPMPFTGNETFTNMPITPVPSATPDVALDENHPTHDGHGDDGDLLAGP